ncbi:M56 family metallopeptidase [Paenibacillus sp. G2S3]|uniref:M56 family metallopeptidase n=1 Tax=Paenibacillus sp. G2S3 TaxID=3047872 RepID=UPI0024C153AD|nr:M56 family metallopeptidase [Paenibacillus sp. G2S3]WHY17570.1 M56 family metallopeptidase [Paenibacillus sp. G2S3]
MITSLFLDLLVISLTTSLVILGLILLTPMLRKHYSAKWSYCIWLILTMRLLLPFNFSFTNPPVDIQLPEGQGITAVFQDTSSQNLQVDPSAISQPVEVVNLSHMPSIVDIVASIWLAGAVLFLVYHLLSYFFFRKQALRWSSSFLREDVVSKLKQVSKEMNVTASIPVLISNKVSNPMLMGFYKPTLFLPHEQYSDEELEFILKHELVHYKRHDIVFKLLLLIAQALHWFNPFVWVMAREAAHEIEIYCDDTVVFERGAGYRKKYCEAILSVMQSNETRHVALSTNFARGKHSMKQRFGSILNMKEKRNGAGAFFAVLMVVGVTAILAACTNVNGQSTDKTLKPGTIYSYSSSGEQVVVHDAGNKYSVDESGNVSFSYRNGEIQAQAPLKLDTTGSELGMGRADTGFFISEDKTAIVYGFADGKKSPLQVLISDDMGETWNNYNIEGAKGYDAKFIGFTDKQNGWIVSGGSAGVGRSLNYVYLTFDGGKTWTEIGNPNDLYAESLTGAGFSNKDIGFLGFRYYEDNGPVIYWTKDKGQSWEKLAVTLPDIFNEYQKTPLSPIFNGKEGLFPILLSKEGNTVGTIYLSSKGYGLEWTYDSAYDQLGDAK